MRRPAFPLLLVLSLMLVVGCDGGDESCGLGTSDLVPIQFLSYTGCEENQVVVTEVFGSSPTVMVGERFRVTGTFAGQTSGMQFRLTFYNSTSDGCSVSISDSAERDFDVVSKVTSGSDTLNHNLLALNRCQENGPCDEQCRLIISPDQARLHGWLSSIGGEDLVLVMLGALMFQISGSTGDYGLGDEVCVEGSITHTPGAALDLTLEVSRVGPPGDC